MALMTKKSQNAVAEPTTPNQTLNQDGDFLGELQQVPKYKNNAPVGDQKLENAASNLKLHVEMELEVAVQKLQEGQGGDIYDKDVQTLLEHASQELRGINSTAQFGPFLQNLMSGLKSIDSHVGYQVYNSLLNYWSYFKSTFNKTNVRMSQVINPRLELTDTQTMPTASPMAGGERFTPQVEDNREMQKGEDIAGAFTDQDYAKFSKALNDLSVVFNELKDLDHSNIPSFRKLLLNVSRAMFDAQNLKFQLRPKNK